MPKYLIQASYTVEGVEAFAAREVRSRRDAVAAAVRGLGGELESFYFGFGDHDAYVTVDLPDNEAAVATALNVNAAGAPRSRRSCC